MIMLIQDNEYKYIKTQIQESIEVKQRLLNNTGLLDLISQVGNIILDAYKKNGKLLICGNGGSAADAQHIAAEFVSRFYFDRPALPSIALTTDTSILTAIGNDYGYDLLFARQIEAHANKNDILLAISTSGNSPNIIKACIKAQELGIKIIGLTGNKNCELINYTDYCIQVPSESTPRIQEAHILIGHIICGYIEQELFKNN